MKKKKRYSTYVRTYEIIYSIVVVVGCWFHWFGGRGKIFKGRSVSHSNRQLPNVNVVGWLWLRAVSPEIVAAFKPFLLMWKSPQSARR